MVSKNTTGYRKHTSDSRASTTSYQGSFFLEALRLAGYSKKASISTMPRCSGRIWVEGMINQVEYSWSRENKMHTPLMISPRYPVRVR